MLIAHPGGPFWVGKDEGSWSIPKGEVGPGESTATAAVREFEEETGHPFHHGDLIDLGTVRQRGGKVVHAFAVAGDFDPETLDSNIIEVNWPPGTGRRIPVPEIDRVAWVTPVVAAAKLNPAQVAFVDRLLAIFDGRDRIDHEQ